MEGVRKIGTHGDAESECRTPPAVEDPRSSDVPYSGGLPHPVTVIPLHEIHVILTGPAAHGHIVVNTGHPGRSLSEGHFQAENVMFQHILVPVDTSTFAERALPHALAVATAMRARVDLVMVHEMRPLGERIATLGSEMVEAQLREIEEEYLETLALRLAGILMHEPGVKLLNGTPAAALSRFVNRKGIDLIVMSTHGRGGFNRAWLGSVADALVRRSRVPILLVKPANEASEHSVASIDRVLVAVDGSDGGELAAAHAATLCAATRAECMVVRVVVPQVQVIASRIPDTAAMVHEKLEAETHESERYLTELPGRINLPGSTRTEVIRAIDTAAAILRAAEADRSDMVVVGTRGHGGATRLILGSVADKVIRGSHVPVLICPSPRAMRSVA
ncbi:MAG: universal stress protein [Gemmatimonadota bacterium]